MVTTASECVADVEGYQVVPYYHRDAVEPVMKWGEKRAEDRVGTRDRQSSQPLYLG